MANLFDEIARNKRRSTILIFLMFLLTALLGGVFGAYFEAPVGGLVVAGGAAIVATLIAWFGGSAMILTISGAKPIEKADHPQLWNVVEELCIAAGLAKMPRIFIIQDSAPNAFATGRNPQNASVAITTGLLEKLDRDELQGVMAHELSHVRNFDIRYAMLVGVMVGAIALFCDMFLRSVRFGGRRSSKNAGGAQAVILVLALVLAILAPISALALQMAISRQREYLADASGAELTRLPEALARALKKIAGDTEVLEAANRATQHLYIVNPIKPFEARASRLFATHPPIEERVKRLEAMGYVRSSAGAAG